MQASSGHPAEAFAAVERARARVLLDLIGDGKPIVRALNAEERAREVQLDRDLLSLNARRAAALRQSHLAPERLRELDDQLAGARRAKDEWEFQVYGAHPDLRFGRGEAPVVSLDEAAAALASDAAVAIFMTGDDRTWLLLLTRTSADKTPSLRIFPIPISRVDLARRTHAFNQQLSQRDLGFAPAARALYDLLLGPIDRQIVHTRRLVIVPDATLWKCRSRR